VAESDDHKWLGPFAVPTAATLAILGMLSTFKSYSETLGWRLVTVVGFVVTTAWALWYLLAKTTENSALVGSDPRQVFLHRHKLRYFVLMLPVLIMTIGILGFVNSREPDYSALLQGGGPYSPVVVLDSTPRGADVRVAWNLEAEDDPLLENRNKDQEFEKKIFRGKTLCRVRLGQERYWFVFLLNGRTLTKEADITVPTVIRANFAQNQVTVTQSAP
jgi:hypothetical protein